MAKTAVKNTATKSAAAAPVDNTRYTAVDAAGHRVYLGREGLPLSDAYNLAVGVLAPTGIARVNADGSLTGGHAQRDRNGIAHFTAA